MTLKITKSDEVIEVSNICFTIYSQPGLGKTSLSFTASRPLMLDFDKGSHRAVNRKDVVQVSDWRDVAEITAADVADHDTIIIDTVGKALDSLSADIIRTSPKLGYGGALNQQGWGQLGTRFGAYLKMLRSFGKDVVLISHMDEKHDGDAIKERLKIAGGSKDLVLTDSDVIARISIFNRQRNLVFSPTESAFGKDPAGIGTMPLPEASSDASPTCLADIISTIKGKLNALSEAQIERQAEVEWFRETLPNMQSADEINGVLGRASQAGLDVKKMVAARAKALGLTFDVQAKEYAERKDAA
ncbi:ATP-binding protein [Salipiger abyssi]|uniref:AAA domain-containing protein n=1 Tax=Salipiger abyssi TaxID=1250539 RepID=A0A1P8UUS6_9RHOB|nr:ATP-binding protein [Salipiger abyssi]APZ53106.1 AAA domain-containing protein [Salipiger abyssi]